MKQRNSFEAAKIPERSRAGAASVDRCEKCGGEVRATRLRKYRNDEFLGFPNLVLVDAVQEEKCPKCGSVEAITIPKVGELIAAAALLRSTMPQKLRGQEIRALRKALGLNARQLAKELGVREEAVSRWENGRDPIGPASEILLRLAVVDLLGEKAPGISANMSDVRRLKIEPTAPSAQPVIITLTYGKVRVTRPRTAVVNAWEAHDKAA